MCWNCPTDWKCFQSPVNSVTVSGRAKIKRYSQTNQAFCTCVFCVLIVGLPPFLHCWNIPRGVLQTSRSHILLHMHWLLDCLTDTYLQASHLHLTYCKLVACLTIQNYRGNKRKKYQIFSALVWVLKRKQEKKASSPLFRMFISTSSVKLWHLQAQACHGIHIQASSINYIFSENTLPSKGLDNQLFLSEKYYKEEEKL